MVLNIGLKEKYILFISVMLTFFSITYTVINITTKEREIRTRLEEKARAMASLLSASAVDPLAALRVEDLRLLLEDVLDQEEIIYAQVFDEHGRIVTDGASWGEQSLRFTVPDDPIGRKAVRADSTLSQYGPNFFEVAEPVYLGGRKLGGVRIGYSLDHMKMEITTLRNQNILLGFFLLVVGIGLTLVLVRALTRSLDKLMVATEALSNGDLNGKISIDSKDELQALASSFNTMTERLKDSKEELQSAHDALEGRVKERTRELREVNESLQKEIEEHGHTERKLIRVQRLTALGEMSAGMGHNLNNILTGIVVPAQLLEMQIKNPGVRTYVSMIRNAAERAVSLVERLHMAVRRKEEEMGPVELNPIVEEIVRTTQPRWKDESEANGLSIHVITELGDIPVIAGTSSGVHDIAMNLLLNALDAMADGGTIGFTTESLNGMVRLVVSDTGCGMDKETADRVFEPFFTTKVGVGSGLGLSTVYGSVTRWGGNIDVESSPGEGTVFTIEFPAWKGTQKIKKPETKTPQVRGAKILVVDDEETVCVFLSKLLSGSHTVETALGAGEAFGKFSAGKFHIAMIDLGMPEVPGNRIAEQMRQMDPGLVTVLITGWNLEEDDKRLSAFDFRLRKPFSNADQIRNVVAKAIEFHDEDAKVRGQRSEVRGQGK